MEKKLPTRKSIRLKSYDYSQDGYYFVTICVKDSRAILGAIDVGAISEFLPAAKTARCASGFFRFLLIARNIPDCQNMD